MACVTAIGGLSLWVGPSAGRGPWDVFTLLNGAYRIYHGQAPSTDFSNPIGPLVYGLAAIGMHFSLSLRAVTYSQMIFVAIVSPLAWTVSSRRLPAPYAAGFTVFVAWLAISVRPLAYSYKTMSYAMLYNTDAWLLYATLLLLVLLPRRKGGQEDASRARGDIIWSKACCLASCLACCATTRSLSFWLASSRQGSASHSRCCPAACDSGYRHSPVSPLSAFSWNSSSACTSRPTFMT